MKKTMIVTGASRGIGAAIAVAAAKAGFDVCVNYLSNAAAAQEVVDKIASIGTGAIAVQADVSREDEVVRLFAETDRQLGAPQVLVNNAGILGHCRVDAMTSEELLKLFGANVFSTFYCSREAVRRMSTRSGGSGGVIVNMSSVASRLGGLPGGSHYAASKGAIDSFTLALAKEVGREGIRVVAVRPGLITTDIHEIHGGLDAVHELAKTVPLGRAGTADEVASTVLNLIDNSCSYVHGAVLDISGGR